MTEWLNWTVLKVIFLSEWFVFPHWIWKFFCEVFNVAKYMTVFSYFCVFWPISLKYLFFLIWDYRIYSCSAFWELWSFVFHLRFFIYLVYFHIWYKLEVLEMVFIFCFCITSYHKLSSLKYHPFEISHFFRWEVWVSMSRLPSVSQVWDQVSLE